MFSARQISRAFDRAMRGTLGSYTGDGSFVQKVADRLGTDAAFVRRVAEEIRNQSDLGERARLALEVEFRRVAGDALPTEELAVEPSGAGVAVEPAAEPTVQPEPMAASQAGTPAPKAYPTMPAADDLEFLADQAEARQYLRRGWRAKQISDFFGWDLEWCQEWCAAEGKPA